MINKINNEIDRSENLGSKQQLFRDNGKAVHTAIDETITSDISKDRTLDLINKQKEVIIHNRFLLGKYTTSGLNIEEHFAGRQLTGNNCIVHAARANVLTNDVNFKEDFRISKITPILDKLETDGRLKTLDKLQDNPISVVGVCKIVAMSPEFVLHYVKMKEDLKAAGQDVSNFHIPRVGDYVNVKSIQVLEDRYYTNKQDAKQDYMGRMVEWNVNKFEYLFHAPHYSIEAIIPYEKVNDTTVPELFFNNSDIILQVNKSNSNYVLATDNDLKDLARRYYAEVHKDPKYVLTEEDIENYKALKSSGFNKSMEQLEELSLKAVSNLRKTICE